MTEPMAADTASVGAFHDTITSSLPTGGDMSSLDAPMRPIDALSEADLDWLKPYVQPLQQVLDAMAGKASVVQSYADSWQHACDSANEVAQQLGQSVQTQTSTWQGSAGDAYRDRAAVIGSALDMTATMCATMSTITSGVGLAAADARKQVNDLVTQLVQELASTIGPAAAAQGPTPTVLAQATQRVNSYQTPVSDVLSQFQQKIADIQAKLGSGGTTGLTPMANLSADDPPQLILAHLDDTEPPQLYGAEGHLHPLSPMHHMREHGHFNFPGMPPIFRPGTTPPPSAPIGAPKSSAPSATTAPSAGKALTSPAAPSGSRYDPPASLPKSGRNWNATDIFEYLDKQLAKKKLQDQNKAQKKVVKETWRGKDYAEAFREQAGPPPKDGRIYVVHHNFPVKNGKDFEKIGIDTSNPIYDSYVPRDVHNNQFNQKVGKMWDDFFANNPNPTRAQALELANKIAKDNGFTPPVDLPPATNDLPQWDMPRPYPYNR